MKSTLFKSGFLAGVLLVTVTSCGSGTATDNGDNAIKTETPKETELKGFMVGGPYFMYGFGGVSAVESMTEKNGTEKEDLVTSYRDLFILPFKRDEQAADVKATLKEWWDIDSKQKLMTCIEDLKTQQDSANPHKAWDFARIVNNACMGYAAGWLTEEETKKYVAETYDLTQKKFKTWAEFLDDYNAGRKTWNPESEDAAQFDKVTADMLKNPNGIYQLLPLHHN